MRSFGVWVKDNPDFAARFDVIMCDEAHNIVVFPTYSSHPNFSSIVRDAICGAAVNPNIMVVSITATPEPLEKLACLQHIISIEASKLRQVKGFMPRKGRSGPKGRGFESRQFDQVASDV